MMSNMTIMFVISTLKNEVGPRREPTYIYRNQKRKKRKIDVARSIEDNTICTVKLNRQKKYKIHGDCSHQYFPLWFGKCFLVH